jgi:hypothetical protein
MDRDMWITKDGTLSTTLPVDAIKHLTPELRENLRALDAADLEVVAIRLLDAEDVVTASYEAVLDDQGFGPGEGVLPSQLRLHSTARTAGEIAGDMLRTVMGTTLDWRWDLFACAQFAVDQLAEERTVISRLKRRIRALRSNR